jgi:hypothetical protein
MTTYTIEQGIPIPPKAHGHDGRPRGPRNPLTQTLEVLEPGQSVLMTEEREYKAAEQFKVRRPERKFAIRKVAREGWRIWRVE